MCSEPVTRTPASGFAAAYFRRIDINPGISFSAIDISLRPQSASDRSATLYSAATRFRVAVAINPPIEISRYVDIISLTTMTSILQSLRVLSDPSRLRVLLLLDREELSVA